MATSTRTRARKTPVKPEVSTEATEQPAEAPVKPEVSTGATEQPAEAPAPAPEAKAPATAYRAAEGFLEATKSLRSLSKENAGLRPLVQLITHLAWRTPRGSVGWSKGTTGTVLATADDLAIGVGTPLPEAMETVLTAAEKEVGETQREAYDVLAGIIRGHAA